MCGIAGFVDLRAGIVSEKIYESVVLMADSISHRGPDDSGVWVDAGNGVALSHRRLSIVDLSPEGRQPMLSACGRYVIIFNGEIYNFKKIKKELDGSGRVPGWRGHSDTEVVLAAITQWGLESAVKRFIGMFAFALWDRKDRILYLVRDRMGEKPLYYGWMSNVFLFASELKALRKHPEWRGEINRDVLTLFLRQNYIIAPYSIYKGICKLRPGTILTLSEKELKSSNTRLPDPKPYWQINNGISGSAPGQFNGGEDQAISMLDDLLRDAIGQQMIADVPLGAFLSGGIDSSTIVAIMQSLSTQPVKTFTIGFNEEMYNEAEYAKQVARHIGTEHTELYVSSRDAMGVIPKLPTLYDEPFSDVSQIPTFLLSQMTKKFVTVSLSGDGGDELFAGYNRYFQVRQFWSIFGGFPKITKKIAASGMLFFPPAWWDILFNRLKPFLPKSFNIRHPGEKLHKLANVMVSSSPAELYVKLSSHWLNSSDVVIGAKTPVAIADDPKVWEQFADYTECMMYLDMLTYLPDDILVKVDRASMGVSLESRVPFLDHRIVEFAWNTPLSMKIRHGQGKWLLRQVLDKYVPKELIDHPKMGFAVPIDTWLRGPLKAWAEELLDERRLREEGFFHSEQIRQKWTEHQAGRLNWQYYIWDVLMFQAWLEEQKRSA